MAELLRHFKSGEFDFDMEAVSSALPYNPWTDFMYEEDPIPTVDEVMRIEAERGNQEYVRQIDELMSGPYGAAARVITYSVHSERHPYYNPTFLWGDITRGLGYTGLYHALIFTRNNAGRIRIIQANTTPNVNTMAWVKNGTFDMRISPSFNFGIWGASLQAYQCAKVSNHEFWHMTRSDGYHTPQAGLMDANGSMPTGNLTQLDCTLFGDRVYAQTTRTRPWLEPNNMRRTFIPGFQAMGAFEEPKLKFGCDEQRSLRERLFGRRLSKRAGDNLLAP